MAIDEFAFDVDNLNDINRRSRNLQMSQEEMMAMIGGQAESDSSEEPEVVEPERDPV